MRLSARDSAAWQRVRQADNVPTSDGAGRCPRSMRLSARDGPARRGVREADRMSPTNGPKCFGHGLRLSGRVGSTGWPMRAAARLPCADDPELRDYSLRLSSRDRAKRSSVRRSDRVRSPGPSQPSWSLRMSEGYGGDRKDMRPAGAAAATVCHARRVPQGRSGRSSPGRQAPDGSAGTSLRAC
jgi:hypothetical protein